MKTTLVILLLSLLLIAGVLSACQPPPMPTGAPAVTPTPFPTPVSYDHQDTPEHLIASYINAINRGEYQRAYDYWETNPLSFDDFITGLENTSHILLTVRLPAYEEGAAGSQYAELVTLLLTTNTDGAQHVDKTCFVARRPNPGMTDTPDEPTPWMIYNATTAPASGSVAWQLATGCPE